MHRVKRSQILALQKVWQRSVQKNYTVKAPQWMNRRSSFSSCTRSQYRGFSTQGEGVKSVIDVEPTVVVDEKPEPVVHVDGPGEKHEFQAETRKLLDIVTNSIYTEKEVFIRELVSNASDALEKLRHLQSTGASVVHPELEPEIHITTNEKEQTLTISDTGVGMTRSELVQNLGTIAHSGSKTFLDQVDADSSTSTGIIGKFGVGFYSAFMVGDKVDVYTQSATSGNESHVWRSDGTGSYEIASTTGTDRGSKIVIHLKDSCLEYAQPKRIESIVKQYSNFVAFPIVLNGEKVNTVEALWTMDPKDISPEQYTSFYKFIANAFDDPLYHLNFKTDAPIELKTLFFVGTTHMEKMGYARMSPGVSLYSRKVLIERNAPDILPDWLRFVRGVIDSEDLPLSISREKMQDTRLLTKIKDIITRRLLRFFDEQARKDPTKYKDFFAEFGQFLKEGLCSEFQYKEQLSKLMRYESSTLEAGEVTSFDDYITRCKPDQDQIYFLCAPTRELALASPYYEAFQQKGQEVLLVYSPIDDFVMNSIGEFNKRKVISAETAEMKMDDDETDDNTTNGTEKLSTEESTNFIAWLKLKLDSRVKDVKISTRLASSPAIITDHESASVRRMMAMVNDQQGQSSMMAKNTLEINPSHPLILQLNKLQDKDEALAVVVAEQIYDNAALAAGLVDDGRTMLPRLNKLLQELLQARTA